MNIIDIERVLPHRYPFLLVDRVAQIDDDRIVAVKMVTRNEPHFEGHFPGHPVMPGVLVIEALAQTGALYAARLTKFDPERQVIYIMAIDKAKFRKPVTPGDQLMLEVTPLRKGGMIWKLRGEAKVGDAVVAEAEFMASIQPKPAAAKAAAPDAAAAPSSPNAAGAAGTTPGASSPEKAEG